MEQIGISIAAAVGTACALAVMAWFTILPAIGVLYLTGYLQ